MSTPTMHQHVIDLPLEPIGPRVTPLRRRSSKRRMGSLDLVFGECAHGRKSWIWWRSVKTTRVIDLPLHQWPTWRWVVARGAVGVVEVRHRHRRLKCGS